MGHSQLFILIVVQHQWVHNTVLLRGKLINAPNSADIRKPWKMISNLAFEQAKAVLLLPYQGGIALEWKPLHSKAIKHASSMFLARKLFLIFYSFIRISTYWTCICPFMQIIELLTPMILNQAEMDFVRIAAFIRLIDCKPDMAILQLIAHSMRMDASNQVPYYIFSHLSSLAMTTNPCWGTL